MIESVEDIVYDVVSSREDWDVTEVTMDGSYDSEYDWFDG